jgi:TRAP-type transport system periplasmic protein
VILYSGGPVRILHVVSLLLALAAGAAAEPRVKLRMAAIAPDGTAWARELKALSRDIETRTAGEVGMKWILGAIAGDELAALERIKKGQLDGSAGALFCERLAPSLWVTRVVGLFRDPAEAHHVLVKLRPTLDQEARENGFALLGVASFGSEIIFSRTPVRNMEDLRKVRLWTWNLDEMWVRELPAMGMRSVALPLEDAARAFDESRLDGFVAVPTAAMAYQWSVRAKYFTELRTAFLPGCMVVHRRAYDALPLDRQQIVTSAVNKFIVRFEDVGRTQDAALLNGLFQHQGLVRVPVSDAFLAEFQAAAQTTREKVGEKLVPRKLLDQVYAWLAEYRAAKHPQVQGRNPGQ